MFFIHSRATFVGRTFRSRQPNDERKLVENRNNSRFTQMKLDKKRTALCLLVTPKMYTEYVETERRRTGDCRACMRCGVWCVAQVWPCVPR